MRMPHTIVTEFPHAKILPWVNYREVYTAHATCCMATSCVVGHATQNLRVARRDGRVRSLPTGPPRRICAFHHCGGENGSADHTPRGFTGPATALQAAPAPMSAA
eukprot:1254769-Prymnesium_polylepis.2